MMLYESSFVQRWHTHPRLARLGQTLGHHQWACAALIAELHPLPTTALVLAALYHDVGEAVTGDMPYMAKRMFGDVLGAYEKEAAQQITGHTFDLSEEDERWLKLVDRLESVLFVRLNAPDLLAHPEWIECIEWIKLEASSLGVGTEVRGML
ncbi:MAG: YfbR-like 5'-deoxynucleotidase [Pseudomonadales bacterium]